MNLIRERQSSVKMLVSKVKDEDGNYKYKMVELKVFDDNKNYLVQINTLLTFELNYKPDCLIHTLGSTFYYDPE